MKAEDAADMMDQDKENDRFKQRAAVGIAILAMLLAITGLGGANAGKEATNNNIYAANQYAFYQAKNIRQTDYNLAADAIELAFLQDGSLNREARAALRAKAEAYRKTAARYESEPETQEGKKELLAQAKDYESKRDYALKQDPYFDYAEALLQIAIVLISVSIVAYREPPSTSTVPNAVAQNRKTMDAAAAMLGARRRSVIVANTRTGPAPSTRAASSCRGSSDSQVTPTVRATTAMLKNTSAARIASTDPSNGVSRSSVRNAMPTTTVGSTNGTSTAARSTPRPRNFNLEST
jgi:hypothetical protein